MKFNTNRSSLILIVIAVAGAGFAFTLPVFPVTYEKSYQVDVPYDELEEYTVQIPYTTMENKQQILINEEDRTLEGGNAKYLILDLSVGKDIEFYFRASNTVNLYIFTSQQYPRVGEGYLVVAPNEKELLDVSQGTLGYRVSATDTYYFVIYNIHGGLLNLGKESVGLYSTKITAYWQEEVTKQRTETRYRTISKSRTETHISDVTRRVTLIGLLSGSYKTD